MANSLAEKTPEQKRKTVKIRTLGVGGEFYLPNYSIDPGTGKEAVYRIIGRAAPGAPQAGRKVFMVKAIHVPQKGEQQTQESKFFDIEYDVVEVARGRKTIDAIDQRDQPDEVETLAEVAAREGVKLDEEGEDK